MEHTEATAGDEIARLRELAAELGAWCEPDYLLMTGYAPGTLEAYRKRGAVEYIRVGRNYFYPKAPAIERFKTATRQAQRRVPAKGLL